jgi:hypothetical protein
VSRKEAGPNAGLDTVVATKNLASTGIEIRPLHLLLMSVSLPCVDGVACSRAAIGTVFRIPAVADNVEQADVKIKNL